MNYDAVHAIDIQMEELKWRIEELKKQRDALTNGFCYLPLSAINKFMECPAPTTVDGFSYAPIQVGSR